MLVIEMLNISHLLTYFLCCSADYTGWSRQFCKMYARLSLRAIWMNGFNLLTVFQKAAQQWFLCISCFLIELKKRQD